MDVQRLAIINMGMCDSRVSWCQLAEGCVRVTGVPWVWYLHTSPPKSITSRLYWKPMGTLLIIIFVKCVWIICKERCMYTANYVLKHLKLKVGHPQVTRLKIGLARQELGDMYLPGWPVSIVYLTIGVCLHSESNANEEIVGTPAEEIKGRSEQQGENPVYRQRTNSWSMEECKEMSWHPPSGETSRQQAWSHERWVSANRLNHTVRRTLGEQHLI